MMMDSGKSETELVRNRFQTYVKRVKGLQKKISEFSTLVDVDACMILYGPKQGSSLPDMYPGNVRDVIRIVKRYLGIPKAERTKRHIDISKLSGDDGKNKIDDDKSNELVSLGDDNNDNDNAGELDRDDDDWFDKLSSGQLQQLIDLVESKIEIIDEKIQFIEDAENPSYVTSRSSSDYGVGATTTTTTTSRGRDTSMQMQQPAYVLQPFRQSLTDNRPMNLPNGSAIVPTMAINGFDFRNFSNNGVATNGSNVHYPMVMQYPMIAVQPGGGNQMEFGNQQGPVTYFVPQLFVQPMASASYIPNLMPGGA